MEKLTNEKLKAEAARLIDQYCPKDALPGESLEGYKQRKQSEAMNNMAKNPQMTSRPWLHR